MKEILFLNFWKLSIFNISFVSYSVSLFDIKQELLKNMQGTHFKMVPEFFKLF